jgi:hypothetical protein
MIKVIYSAIFIVLFFGCSSSQKVKVNENSDHYITGVELNQSTDGEKSKPVIEKVYQSGSAGPAPLNASPISISSEGERKKAIGVYLGPGMYHSLRHVGFLKALKEEGLKIHAISGNGLGAVVAALYAFGFSTDLIEWKFFQFLSKTDGVSAYSKKWLEHVDEILLKPLSGKTLQEAKLLLAFPVFNISSSEIIYKTRGNVDQVLRTVLKIKKNDQDELMSVIHWGNSDHGTFKKLGIDVKVSVAPVSYNFKSSNSSSLWARTYRKVLSQSNSEVFDHLVTLSKKAEQIDSGKDVSELITSGQESSTKFIKEELGQYYLQNVDSKKAQVKEPSA